MSERDVLFTLLVVAFITTFTAIGAVYVAWRDREKFDIAMIAALLQGSSDRSAGHKANGDMSQEQKRRVKPAA